MKYPVLLKPSSPKLARLEAKLGVAGVRPERACRQGTRLCADGRIRGCRISLSKDELEAWFWGAAAKNKGNGCWEWKSTIDVYGYGTFTNHKTRWLSNRFAAVLILGAEPQLFVLHTCDNPSCVNPSHLWLGTHEDNMKDKIEKGRARFWGHPVKAKTIQ